MWPNIRRMWASRLSSSAVDTLTPIRRPRSAKPKAARRGGLVVVVADVRGRCHRTNRTPGRGDNMLSVEGCRQRRQWFLHKLDPFPAEGYAVLADPMHLIYLANFCVDPISSGASFGGF